MKDKYLKLTNIISHLLLLVFVLTYELNALLFWAVSNVHGRYLLGNSLIYSL